MFENLDDPQPPDAAPAESVAARGRRLLLRRRALVAGACTVVAVSAVTFAVVASQHSSSPHVAIAADTTTSSPDTTNPVSTTTATTATPDTSDTSTAPTNNTVPVGAPTTDTTTTTVPHDPHDYSQLHISFGDPLGIRPGVERDVTYTVTNLGAWDVSWTGQGCPFELWSTPPSQPIWGPYTEIWPQADPAPARVACAALGTFNVLKSGDTQTFTEHVVAGYLDGNGDIVPAPPGYTSVPTPFATPCGQPCDYNHPDSLPVTIYPPDWPPPSSLWTIDVTPAHLTAPTGQSADVTLDYTNGLPFGVRMPLWGPCWTVTSGTGTVDCSQPVPTVTVGAHAHVTLHGTVWARQGFTAGGAPLAAGKYSIEIGDRKVEFPVT
jgi:hypothetical protein